MIRLHRNTQQQTSFLVGLLQLLLVKGQQCLFLFCYSGWDC